jgi:hypothetical protein
MVGESILIVDIGLIHLLLDDEQEVDDLFLRFDSSMMTDKITDWLMVVWVIPIVKI